MNANEISAELKSWGDRWGSWIGPKGDEARYKRMAECAYAGSEAVAERDQLRAEVERLRGDSSVLADLLGSWFDKFAVPYREAWADRTRLAQQMLADEIFAATARAEAAEAQSRIDRKLTEILESRALTDALEIQALLTTVAGLRRALGGFKAAWQAWPPSTDGLAHAVHFGNAMEAADGALDASPDDHARRIKAEALRELAEKMRAMDMDIGAEIADAEADRLEDTNDHR